MMRMRLCVVAQLLLALVVVAQHNSSGNHLWFSTIGGALPFENNRCGEVDVASRIPQALFEPQNAAVLKRYIKVTQKFYGGLKNKRCSEVKGNFTQYDGTITADYLPNAFVPICRTLCGCTINSVWQPGSKVCKETPLYCACQDVPDKPSKFEFCSLCGPKYNAPIDVTLYVEPGSTNIVSIARARPDLSTLVTALKAADLVGSRFNRGLLDGKGPFTVFAPTNEAFAALPAGVLANLLKPENKAQLVDILTYHVASGDVHAKDLYDMEMIPTVEGKNVTARVSGGNIFINSAKVTAADNDASNGVVHIIDAVLTPGSTERLAVRRVHIID